MVHALALEYRPVVPADRDGHPAAGHRIDVGAAARLYVVWLVERALDDRTSVAVAWDRDVDAVLAGVVDGRDAHADEIDLRPRAGKSSLI